MAITTPKFRVSYPTVFKPRKNNLSQKMEYSIMALFEKGQDLSKIQQAVVDAATEKWGDKKNWPKGMRNPFKDQGTLAKKDENGNEVLADHYTPGAIYLNLKSEQPPKVVNENVEPIMEQSEFYAGCYARASVSVYAYDKGGNKGVNFGLNNIQKMGDGDSIGGTRTTPEEDFAPVEGAGGSAEASDATAMFG